MSARPIRRRWLLLAAVPIMLAGTVMVGSVGVAVVYESSKTSLPVTDADRALVLEVDELRGEFAGRTPSPGSLEKFGYFDGTWEVSYHFEDEATFLMSSVAREGSERDAKVAMRAAWGGLRMGAELMDGDAQLVTIPGFRAGDERRLARIELDGAPVGSVAAVRIGHCVVTLVLEGTWFRSADEAEAALAASLRAVAEVEALSE